MSPNRIPACLPAWHCCGKQGICFFISKWLLSFIDLVTKQSFQNMTNKTFTKRNQNLPVTTHIGYRQCAVIPHRWTHALRFYQTLKVKSPQLHLPGPQGTNSAEEMADIRRQCLDIQQNWGTYGVSETEAAFTGYAPARVPGLKGEVDIGPIPNPEPISS